MQVTSHLRKVRELGGVVWVQAQQSLGPTPEPSCV